MKEHPDQQPLFEVISADQYRRESTPRGTKQKATEPRTLTVWFALSTTLSACTVPAHDEVIQSLSLEEREYRYKTPIRMVARINNYDVCRDCFVEGADKHEDREISV